MIEKMVSLADEESARMASFYDNGFAPTVESTPIAIKNRIIRLEKICSDCGKSFPNEQTLRAHSIVHFGLQPFVCSETECGQRFGSELARIAHERTHEEFREVDQNPFTELFGSKKNEAVTDRHRYVCRAKNCGKSFANSHTLKYHHNIHTGYKPYVCSEKNCGKSFHCPSGLTVHRRRHTGGRQYVCGEENCGKSFSQRQNLIYHQNVHYGLRPFVCSEKNCGKSFSYRSSLVVHKRTHTGARQYICSEKHFKKSFDDLHLEHHNELSLYV